MASYSIIESSITDTSVDFKVSGLQSTHTSGRRFYWYSSLDSDDLRHTIAMDSLATDGKYSPSLYNAASVQEEGEKLSEITHSFTGLSPGTTWYFACLILAYNYDAIYATSTILSATTTGVSRPPDWNWQNTPESKAEILLGAGEWTLFGERINAFREYKKMNSYTFSIPSSGDEISASIVNEAINAINAISGHGAQLPSTVTRGTLITADFFNNLAGALNAIE